MNKSSVNLQFPFLTFIILTANFFLSTTCNAFAGRDYYQIKIYSIDNETQEKRIDAYLEKAFIPALHRAGINSVGVFKPIEDDPLSGKRIFVWIPFKAADEFAKLPGILDKDEQYLKDGKDYIEAAHDNAPYARIESILLRSFKGMPIFQVPEHPTAKSERIYELRSYQGATEKIYERKVEMFNDAGEIELFIKLGFQPVFFGEVILGSDMPNLMYMTSFSDKAAQDEYWKAFVDSPEWQKMKEIDRYKNTVSHIDKFLLHPADYSDF
ncbi:NIPSNAP family protein [Bacteroidota bacterium]